MEEFADFWSYEESVDELKQRLLCTTVELEQLKMETGEERRKNKEYVKQLIAIFNVACQERDEARDQLQKILNKLIPSTNQHDLFSCLPQLQPGSPRAKATKANSSIAESNSFGETYKFPSHGSSPADTFLGVVSSPELSNINTVDAGSIAFTNEPLIQDYKATIGNNTAVSSGLPKLDHASLVLEHLAKEKDLPPKGKFLNAVLDARPLLENLLVAGPLPRWRNPPQLHKVHIPHMSINSCDAGTKNLQTAANINPIASGPLTGRPYADMSCTSSQVLSTSLFNIANGPSASCLGGDHRLISASTNANSNISWGKRQRFN